MKTKRCGFTLVELLVVIGIIGILSAFIYPAIRRAILKGKITQTKTHIMNLSQAIRQYYSDFNAYPDFFKDTGDATPIGRPETQNDLIMRQLTGRYWNGSQWEDDDGNKPTELGIKVSKRWNGPYIELNETEAYKIGNDLAPRSNATGYFDGYQTVTNRAAFVDGWKNDGRATYFLFKFPDPQETSAVKRLPIFSRDSFDIYSAGPDGRCRYTTLNDSDYNPNGYKNYEMTINGVTTKINEDNPNNWK